MPLSDPGLPTRKLDWRTGIREGFQGPGDPDTAFAYEDGYRVFARNVHGTVVVVAVHSSLAEAKELRGWALPAPELFADRIFQAWELHWRSFGGYAYDRYVIKVAPITDPAGWSLARVGIVLGPVPPGGFPGDPPHYYAEGVYNDLAVHEMVHSWNGKLVQYEPDGSGNLFQIETWIVEGATIYLTKRARGEIEGRQAYFDQMRGLVQQYNGYAGTQFDLGMKDLAARIGRPDTVPPPAGDYSTMLFARAALVSYLLDTQLKQAGSSLDELLTYLYREYGLKGRRWTEADLGPALQAVSGRSFDDFLRRYVEGNERLPIDANFHVGVRGPA